MSPDQSKPEGNLKKQLISLGIIVVLVIGGWYLSAVVTNWIFKQDQYDSVDILDDTDPFPVELDGISPPNFTPPEDWGNFDMNLLNLLAGLPFLSGAFGNFTDIDQFNTVAFRVYETPFSNLEDDDLWRYSAYDEYQGNGWARSVEYSTHLEETWDSSPYANEYQLRVPHGASEEIQIALPHVFPSPRIGGGYWTDGSSIIDAELNVDSQNGTTITFTQESASAGNFTYPLYGNDPKPESYYQYDSNYPINAPQIIKDQYLQFPSPGKQQYYINHPYFAAAVDQIDSNINLYYGYSGSAIPSNVRTFEIVDIVRTYLESNYELDLTFPFERPGTSDDVVEWFLERGSGLPMDFAAAFVMLCRWFAVPCRYAAGYNSLYTSTEFDPYWNGGANYRDIRMVNMDAWNEVFMPMTAGKPSEFTPLLLSGVSFPPITNGSSNPLHILINGTYTAQSLTYRGFDVNITAELPSGDSGVSITFRDETEEITLTQIPTINGRASYVVNIDNSVTAGAHFISVQASIFQRNACAVVLDDEVTVFMTSLNPTVINRATENETQVAAYIYDPENGNRVKNAVLHPVVVQAGAAIPNSVDPPNDAIKVDGNGAINELVRISDYVSQGSYQFRVDFNGTYSLIDPVTGMPQEITIPAGLIDDSSNTLPFMIIDDNQKIFDLYVDSGSVGEDTTFYKTRAQSIYFDIYLKQGLLEVNGGIVEIRDRTYNDYVVATLVSASDGTASTTYSLSTHYGHWVGGVHELYGIWTNGGGRLNQSYYLVVDEPLTLQITNTPGPNVDRTGGTSTIHVEGNLFDADPLVMDYSRYAWMSILLRDSALNDYTGSLTGSLPYFNSPTGMWIRNYGVLPTIPLGNYEVYAGFNGDWQLPNGYSVSDASFSTLSSFKPITIYDPSDINIEFEIDGTPTQTTYFGSSAPSYARYSTVNLYARIWQSGTNPFNVPVSFYDENTGQQIGSTQYTNGNGEVSLAFGLNNNFAAGLNLISVAFGSNKNYSQVYLNAPVQIIITGSPASSGVRESDQMIVSGVLRDLLNNPIRGAEMRLDVMDGAIDRTNEISTWVTPSTSRYTFTSQSDGTFSILWKMPYSFQGDFDISVTFTGYQEDHSTECLANYNNPAQSVSSTPTTTTVLAGSDLTAFYSPHPWVMGQPIVVTGQLTDDLGSPIAGASVTIRFYDSSHTILHLYIATTNSTGGYYYAPILTWQHTDSIYVEYAGNATTEGTIVQAAYAGP